MAHGVVVDLSVLPVLVADVNGDVDRDQGVTAGAHGEETLVTPHVRRDRQVGAPNTLRAGLLHSLIILEGNLRRVRGETAVATVKHAGHTFSLPDTGDVPGLDPGLAGFPRVDPGRYERPRGELQHVEIESAGGGGGVAQVRRLECQKTAAGVRSGDAVHISAGVEVSETSRFVALAGADTGLGGLVGAEHVGRAVGDEVSLADFLPLLHTLGCRGEFLS